MEVMNTIKYNGRIGLRKEEEVDIKIAPTRLIWIPGIKPVNVPARLPKINAIIISISIALERFNN